MNKCFKKGFIYVFSKEKFLKSMGHRRYVQTYTKPWVDECDGKTVEVVSNREGEVGEAEYGVIPEWCKCIGRQK